MRIQLENRLIDFSVAVNKLISSLNNSLLAYNLSKQLIRSSTSAALNFEEAQSAESRNDFIHKVSIVLKELRETEISLKIIERTNIYTGNVPIHELIGECKELAAIFQKSINTAKANIKKSDELKISQLSYFEYCILYTENCIFKVHAKTLAEVLHLQDFE